MTCSLAAMIFVTVFAYSPRVSENDADPWTTACGSRPFSGSIAVSQDLFGLRGLGCGDSVRLNGRRLIVNDTMHWRHSKTVDIWQSRTADAVQHGRRRGVLCPSSK